MLTNIIIGIVVILVATAIIMNWIRKQEFCKFVDDIFELLVNPKTQYLSIYKWQITITLQVIAIGKEGFTGDKVFNLTEKYSIYISRKENEESIFIWVKLLKNTDVVYERHAQLSR